MPPVPSSSVSRNAPSRAGTVTSLLQLGQMALLNGAIVLTSIRAWQKGQIIRWTGSN